MWTWFCFQLLVAQGGVDTTQVFARALEWNPEDVATDSLVNAVVELQSEPHVKQVDEVVDRYKGRGELPSDVGRWSHYTTAGVIHMLLAELGAAAPVQASGIHRLETAKRHDSSDIYTIIEQVPIGTLHPRELKKTAAAPADDNGSDDDFSSRFQGHSAAAERAAAAAAGGGRCRTRRAPDAEDPHQGCDGDTEGPVALEDPVEGVVGEFLDNQPPRRTVTAARGVEAQLELPPGSLDELFGGPEGPDGDAPAGYGSDSDDPGAEDGDAPGGCGGPGPTRPGQLRSHPAEPAGPAVPDGPAPSAPRPPDPASADFLEVSEADVLKHYKLELIEHVYSRTGSVGCSLEPLRYWTRLQWLLGERRQAVAMRSM